MVAGRGEPDGSTPDPPPRATGKAPRSRKARGRDTAEIEREGRLAELVSGLTGSPQGHALHAVRHDDGPDTTDALEVVARAMVKVDQPPPKELRLPRLPRDGATSGDADGHGQHGDGQDGAETGAPHDPEA